MTPPTAPRAPMTLDRLLARDVLDPAVAILVAAGVAITFLIRGSEGDDRLPLVILIAASIAWIRRWPLAVFIFISVATVATRGAGGWLDVAVFVAAAASVGTGTRRVEPSLAIVAIDASLMGIGLVSVDAAAWALFAPLLLAVPAWLAGDVVRMRRLAVLASAEAAAEQERHREAALREAAREERRHMARELHDIVAHSVSVMVIQAGAARQVVADDPARATESLLAIEATGREAMTELRRIVGVLGEEGDGLDLAPQPGVAQLDALVERVADAGLPIEFRVDGERRPLPAAVDVTAYRIVQEALTNALKYAGRARTVVALEFRPLELKLEIADDGAPGPSAGEGPAPVVSAATEGRGLVGMRERAVQCGGRLEAGPRLGGGFAVRAWLPTGGVP